VSLISPLNRVLGLGSAKGGTEHWWVQRLTAVALVPLGLWLLISLATLETSSYAAVVEWMQRPMTGIMLLLTVLVVVYHSYLGVQVVVEDYVGGRAKVVTLVLSTFAHVFICVAAVYSILRVAFGAM
jgi:succinate dehydrogenase / fumarate reductase membrane anchor subunit